MPVSAHSPVSRMLMVPRPSLQGNNMALSKSGLKSKIETDAVVDEITANAEANIIGGGSAGKHKIE